MKQDMFLFGTKLGSFIGMMRPTGIPVGLNKPST